MTVARLWISRIGFDLINRYLYAHGLLYWLAARRAGPLAVGQLSVIVAWRAEEHTLPHAGRTAARR